MKQKPTHAEIARKYAAVKLAYERDDDDFYDNAEDLASALIAAGRRHKTLAALRSAQRELTKAHNKLESYREGTIYLSESERYGYQNYIDGYGDVYEDCALDIYQACAHGEIKLPDDLVGASENDKNGTPAKPQS